jgi:hypothetical protein
VVGAPLSSSVFYGEWYPGPSDRYVIEQFAASSGAPLRKIASLPRGVSDLYRGTNGSLWWSVSGGSSSCPAGALECYPKPDTCHDEFESLTSSGAIQVALRLPDSVEARDPVPDPRGGEVAFIEGVCTHSAENEHIVVRNLRTGAQWSIGANAKVCHLLSPPAWNSNGSRLVFAYGPSLVTSSTNELGLGEMGCLAPAPGALVTVAANASSSTTTWHLASADAGCGYTSAVFDAWGVAAVETCGANGGLGDAYLVQLTNTLARVARFVLAPGSNPTTLSASPSGTLVLIDEYESTGGGNSGVPEDTVVPPGEQPGPYIWVETFDGKGLHVIRRWGNISVNLWGLTW